MASRDVGRTSKQQIGRLIAARLDEDGLLETGVTGVQLCRLAEPVCCAPELKRRHGESRSNGAAPTNQAPLALI
jgi:hypothetical protein